MRFFADESCDFAIVRALRGAGHEVLAVAQTMSGAVDEVVLQLALLERRILLTEDRDFGQLVYASSQASSGVLYARYPAPLRHRVAVEIVTLVAEQGERLIGAFVVVQPGRYRLGRLPTP